MDINIYKILEQCDGLDYVVLRNAEGFDNYPIGGDVDILTRDISAMVGAIMGALNDYIFNGYVVNKKIPDSHTHIDLLKDGVLIVRFDIINALTLDTTSLVGYLLANRKKKNNIMFTDEVGDIFTRLLEYFNNSTKVKHLDFIKNKYKI